MLVLAAPFEKMSMRSVTLSLGVMSSAHIDAMMKAIDNGIL